MPNINLQSTRYRQAPSNKAVNNDYLFPIVNDLEAIAQEIENLPTGGVQSVTGDLVDNTDPENPIINSPEPPTIVSVGFANAINVTNSQRTYNVDSTGKYRVYGTLWVEFTGVADSIPDNFNLRIQTQDFSDVTVIKESILYNVLPFSITINFCTIVNITNLVDQVGILLDMYMDNISNPDHTYQYTATNTKLFVEKVV